MNRVSSGGIRVPVIPAAGEHLWIAFWKMSARRGSSGLGVSPISHSEIRSYQQLYGERFSDWDVDTIAAMDNAFLVEISRKGDKTKPAMQPATDAALRN